MKTNRGNMFDSPVTAVVVEVPCAVYQLLFRLNVQVQVYGTDKCSMSAFSTEQFFTMTFKLFTFFSSSCFAGENINSLPDNYLYKPVFSFTV